MIICVPRSEKINAIIVTGYFLILTKTSRTDDFVSDIKNIITQARLVNFGVKSERKEV